MTATATAPTRADERRQMLDHFAECLANDGDVARCAARLGKSQSWGAQALSDIRRGLGWQAQ